MQKETIIISVIYLEPDWMQTKKCIDDTGLPAYFVERNPPGIGSLAEAINRGFVESNATDYKYAWIVTNITFNKHTPHILADGMGDYAAIHPAFDSDHIHERPDGSGKVKPVPFVEFTAAMVRTSVFKDYPLDEKLPFWGHDPDHGLRMWQNGYKVGVHHGCKIGHTYIRNNKQGYDITVKRKALRRSQDGPTKQALAKKYGQDWRWMFPRSEEAINNYWKKLANERAIHRHKTSVN